MKKNLLGAIVFIFVVVLGGLIWYVSPDANVLAPTEPVEPVVENNIQLDSLKIWDSVKSPLTITGSARGTWFFEASFPIDVVDKDGKVIAQGYAEAQSDWMTENFVPFKALINFNVSTTQAGEIVLKKDNPSGLPEHDKEMRIPVTLQAPSGPQRTVKLFFYNPNNDQDTTGNILCSNAGMVSVTRQIPVSQTPIQDTIKAMLRGEISFSERQQGIGTEFPLEGVELKGALLKDGILTLEFLDPNHKTSGGSCRAEILWAQIEATAKQFPEVKEVKFKPEDLFQS